MSAVLACASSGRPRLAMRLQVLCLTTNRYLTRSETRDAEAFRGCTVSKAHEAAKLRAGRLEAVPR